MRLDLLLEDLEWHFNVCKTPFPYILCFDPHGFEKIANVNVWKTLSKWQNLDVMNLILF